MGNYDEGTGFDADECGCAYTNPTEKSLGDASFAWTKEHVSDANKAWLRTLEREIRFEADGLRVLLVHGSPRRINEYLYEDKPESTFARIAADAEADLIVCGHTHRPYEKSVAGVWFVNDGSAGKPKDGDPRACWALVDTSRQVGDLPPCRVRHRANCPGHPGQRPAARLRRPVARGSRLREPHRGRALSDDQAGSTPDSGGPGAGGRRPSLPAVWPGDGDHRGSRDHRPVGRSPMMALQR